ncbi:repressor CpxP [Escherichia coli]|uniref:Repressor CpxP n=1 Tax=Escherichia coli TaxID=562 RepID=A0A377B772_ECOLX|nr:repressor CpxP [Escherichia coli]
MRIVTAAVMASTLAVSSLSHAAEVGSGDNWHPGEELTQRSTQSHMFGRHKFNRTSASADARSYATGPARTASC